MPTRATDAGTNRRATRSNDTTASPCILALDPGHKLGYAVDDPAAPNRCRIWNFADDRGVIEERPKQIKGQLFRFDDCTVGDIQN